MPRYTRPRRTWKYGKVFKLKAVKLTFPEGVLPLVNLVIIKKLAILL